MRLFFLFLLLSALTFTAPQLAANNISVNGLNVTQDMTTQDVQVTFSISWQNSWSVTTAPANHDAAWIFAKYQVNGNDWQHLPMPASWTQSPNTATVEVVAGTGAMMSRSAAGIGSVNFINNQFVIPYADLGLADEDVLDIRVFAVEMVYVPSGNFFVGDRDQAGIPGTLPGFYTLSGTLPISKTPYEVAGEGELPVSLQGLYYSSDYGDQQGPIPAAFPKGWGDFYCMKYELSQQQYVDFFNTLTGVQQEENLPITAAEEFSIGYTVDFSPDNPELFVASTSFPDVPAGALPTFTYLTYLDWAGLRPPTELEYEKACRGPLEPVEGEFAWGTNGIVTVADRAEGYDISSRGQFNSRITDPVSGKGNANYSWIDDGGFGTFLNPFMRCGVFAASAATQNREETGATYYGIMEMAGNMPELTISVSTPNGRAFTGQHGDGVISADGRSNVTNWPTDTESTDYILRGGSLIDIDPVQLQISNRTSEFDTSFGIFQIRGIRSL